MIASGRRKYIAIFLDHSTIADCKRLCGEASVSEPPNILRFGRRRNRGFSGSKQICADLDLS
jgi:hypothetical protein